MISTRLTRMLGIRHPVIQAGMGGVARADLVAAMSNASGLGMLGTRFVASEESEAQYKKRLLGASESDTVYTEAFHVGWPPHSPHRVLRSTLTEGATPPQSVARLRVGEQTVDVPAFSAWSPTIHTEGHTELMANYAGQGVGLIHNILPAAEIVERIVSEAEDIIRRLPTML